jgi:hypothetical protein
MRFMNKAKQIEGIEASVTEALTEVSTPVKKPTVKKPTK